MDSSAPWREIEAGAAAAETGRTQRPRIPVWAAALGLAALLVAGSVAAVALTELKPGGRIEVVPASGPAASGEAVASRPMVVVEVSGAVAQPGVYSLPAGSRVADAIEAAGGYSTDVDPRAAESKLNLAAKLQDAQLIVVPRRGDTAGGSTSGGSAVPASFGLIDLNTATTEQLDTLPGIGPATAAKIVASREQLRFASVDDLVTRKLVTAAVLAKFRDRVTAG